MLGGCYYGGSANSTKDEERLMYASFMTKGFNCQVRAYSPSVSYPMPIHD
jgi:hypothetical protein